MVSVVCRRKGAENTGTEGPKAAQRIHCNLYVIQTQTDMHLSYCSFLKCLVFCSVYII